MTFQKIKRFLQSEDGPTAVEYAVMLAMVIMVCFATIATLGQKTVVPFTTMGNSLGAAS